MVFIRHLSRIIQQKSNLLPFFFQSPFTYPLSWGLFILIFLGPNLLSIAIGAIFLRIGMEKGNKALLYTSFLLYMLSIILAYDPDWGVYRIAPIVLGILVLIGTLLAKEDKEVLRY